MCQQASYLQGFAGRDDNIRVGIGRDLSLTTGIRLWQIKGPRDSSRQSFVPGPRSQLVSMEDCHILGRIEEAVGATCAAAKSSLYFSNKY